MGSVWNSPKENEKNLTEMEESAFHHDGKPVICCLGLQLNRDGSAAPELQERCLATVEVAKRNPEAMVILTGGDPLNIGVTEAEVMARSAKLVIGSAGSGSPIPGSRLRNPDPDP